MRKIIFSLLLLLIPSSANATTINAATCSLSDVQTAVNSAATTGDTVQVPSGNCTWSSFLVVNKGLVLKGAGIDVTNITVSGSLGIEADYTSAHFIEITAFTFLNSTGGGAEMIDMNGDRVDAVSFRVHHNKFTLSAGSTTRGVVVQDLGWGLIDHNTFDATGSGSIQSLSIFGTGDGNDGGFTPWTQPLSLGTNKAVYIEDNMFTYSAQAEDSIDAYGGARLVVRHNTFNNISLGFHGTDSGNRRSVFSYEIYSNTFTNNSSTDVRAATLRGGTGVIYSNTYGGSHGYGGVTMMLYRACPGLDNSGWGHADGTAWLLQSSNLSDIGSRTVCTPQGTGCNVLFLSTAPDTLCTFGAANCTRNFDGAGTGGYPARDQVGRTHDQALSPLYVWNNGGVAVGWYDGGFSCGVGLDNYFQAGRDYYNDGTQMPGYAALTYPHPLLGGAVAIMGWGD